LVECAVYDPVSLASASCLRALFGGLSGALSDAGSRAFAAAWLEPAGGSEEVYALSDSAFEFVAGGVWASLATTGA
jgi:hypothetical protein